MLSHEYKGSPKGCTVPGCGKGPMHEVHSMSASKSKQNWMDQFLDGQVLLVTPDAVFGPFPDERTAQGWIDAPHSVEAGYIMIRLHSYVAVGTDETAHECGTVLSGNSDTLDHLDEATPEQRRQALIEATGRR